MTIVVPEETHLSVKMSRYKLRLTGYMRQSIYGYLIKPPVSGPPTHIPSIAI
ncbi:hypothetical protein J2T26_004903 [Citrobacter farmeri]|nr:hypothetical protein [Citrobacter farmeri]MCW2425085.1 hypothetical protein [Citrobacter farmeri]